MRVSWGDRRSRLIFAGTGFLLSTVSVLMAIAIPSSEETTETIVVAFTILVSAVACGIIATFMRPFD